MTAARYDPWRDARDNWPHVQIVYEPLPPNVLGIIRCDGQVIVIDQSLPRRQARCVLAHELVHLERGFTNCRGPGRAKEERIVHAAAARRLITLPQLAAGIIACGEDVRSLSVELDVDQATLQVHRAMLTEAEQLAVRRVLDACEMWLAPTPG